MLDFARKVFRRAQSTFGRIGLDIRYVGHVDAEIPDKSLYRPYFSPWISAEWQRRLGTSDVTSLVTADRKYVLWNLLRQSVKAIEGDVIECGVYRGGTAHMFAQVITELQSDKRLHLFDTFAGMPQTNEGYDLHRAGDFADTSLDAVKAYLSPFRVADFHPGFIPDSFSGLEKLCFCFAHIDLDLYDPIREASNFVYARMPRGGVIVYDDYGLPSTPGARRAVDEFFEDKPESALTLQTGQCVVFKT